MTIYRMIYPSGPYMVKGYLGLPNSLKLREGDLSLMLGNAAHWNSGLIIEEIADDSASKEDTVHLHAKFPGLVYCRGGIGQVGMVKLKWIQEFVERGFVVFAPSYRGSEGGEGIDEFGGADCEDTHAAVRILMNLPFVKKERVSVMGFSRGSINAFCTAIHQPDIYRLVLWGGVSDLEATYTQRPDLRRMLRRVLHGSPANAPKAYHDRSAIFRAKEIPCPTLLVHGNSDIQVDVSHAHNLYSVLQAQHQLVDIHLYEGYGHHLPSPVHEAVIDRWTDWLQKDHLKTT